MACDSDDCDHDWHYASPRSVAGALQHGLGRGAHRALADSAAPDLVAGCLRRDYRWDWQVDERHCYLARLVRDLAMPIGPITARLHAAPPHESDDDNEFAATLGVLEVLARAGLDGVVAEVRRYIRDGDRWLDALQTVAGTWPAAWWNDLYPVLAGRLDATADEIVWPVQPWTTWAGRDARIAAAVKAAQRRPRPPQPFAHKPATDLLALLRDAARADDWGSALRELRRRPPEPNLLDLIDDLVAAGVGSQLNGAIERLGALALPAARLWATTPGHPLTWTGLRLLAAHGEAGDIPAIVGGMDWLDSRPGDLCG